MMTERRVEKVEALALQLHGLQVGILVHYSGGKNILTFDPTFSARGKRPILTLAERSQANYLSEPQIRSHRLPPLLSNLLPEGALREHFAQTLKVDLFNEFPMLAASGRDLPGALIARPIRRGEIPAWALNSREQVEPVQIDLSPNSRRFSLAGVQMKFSGINHAGRFTLSSQADQRGDHWIIKTPSPSHPHVPENEYTCMSLAADIGIDIPEIRLLTTDKLDGLAGLSLPSEPHAYAIRRFDRLDGERIHSEDFAQILNLYPNDKYDKANYEMIGRLLYQYSDSPLIDLQQFARRLLANILLANGDAHLKNWSLHYPQQRQVRLAPAYDLVATLVYIPTETGMALKLGNRRKWADLSFDSFQRWCERIGAPWPAIRIHLYDAIMAARERWPKLLETLPMIDSHKAVLQQHWRTLPEDFRIQC